MRHVDPLQIDQLNITSLPTVNLTMSQLPALDINVRRVPPVAVALHQQFEMCSRLHDDGAHSRPAADAPRSRAAPPSHRRTAPGASNPGAMSAASRMLPPLGNPAIPSRAIETCTETVTRGSRRHPDAATASMPARRASASPCNRPGRAQPAADSAVNGG